MRVLKILTMPFPFKYGRAFFNYLDNLKNK